MELDKDLRSIQEVRGLIAQARRAQRVLERMSQADLDKITAAISAAAAEHARRLGRHGGGGDRLRPPRGQGD